MIGYRTHCSSPHGLTIYQSEFFAYVLLCIRGLSYTTSAIRKGRGVKKWSKLLKSSTTKLSTWGRGLSKIGKNCRHRLWMVPYRESSLQDLKDMTLSGALLRHSSEHSLDTWPKLCAKKLLG